MADTKLRDARGIEGIELNAGDNGQSDSEVDGDIPPAEELPPEQALVRGLRQFIQSVPRKKEEAPPKKLGRLQLFTLILLSADAALIYSQLEHWLQNPLFQEVLKILPWILGATAVGYANALRELLVEKARHLKWAIIAAILLAPMLVAQMRVFSIAIYAEASDVKADDKSVFVTQSQDGHFRVVFPRLDEYRISVDERGSGGNAAPFVLEIGRWRILRGTLAQIPLVGRLFGPREMELSPLYSVGIISAEAATVYVEGAFKEGFVDDVFLSTLPGHCQSAKPRSRNNQAIQCLISGYGGLSLPNGEYTFTLQRSGCHQEVSLKIGKSNNPIEVDKLCPKKG